MTIEGAIAELRNLIKADDVPFYYNGTIQKVIETIIDECKPKVGRWTRTGRTNVYGGEELMCPFCGDRVIVQNIEYELYCRQCGALLGDRAKGEADE